MYALSVGPVLAEVSEVVLPDQIIDGELDWRALAGAVNDGPSSPLVCTCFEVSELAIVSALAAGCDSLDQLGAQLKCGTNCGSCIPELNQMLKKKALKTNLTISG
jgi:NAD(P)H-nitrite reductase large subunit